MIQESILIHFQEDIQVGQFLLRDMKLGIEMLKAIELMITENEMVF